MTQPTQQIQVLIVEDEDQLRDAIHEYLVLSGFACSSCGTLKDAQKQLDAHHYDFVLLDLGLPDGDGLDLFDRLQAEQGTGVIVVTARGQTDARIRSYELGADHHLVKPVNLRELVVILQQLQRRLDLNSPGWTLDSTVWQLMAPSGHAARLTESERSLLIPLMQQPGDTVDKATLIRALGHEPEYYDLRRLEILIRRLRNKIQECCLTEAPIETVHARGYAFTASANLR